MGPLGREASLVNVDPMARREAATDEEEPQGAELARRKTKLGLPNLDDSVAVLANLCALDSQESHGHAIDEFTGCSGAEPRPSFNPTVVTVCRIHFEDRRLAPGFTNVRLAAGHGLAYEAADSGLLSPDLPAGIRGCPKVTVC